VLSQKLGRHAYQMLGFGLDIRLFWRRGEGGLA